MNRHVRHGSAYSPIGFHLESGLAGRHLRQRLAKALLSGREPFISAIDEMISAPLTLGLVSEARAMTEKLHTLLSSDEFTQFILTAIRRDDRWLQQLLLESKVHENGFFKLVLCEGNEFKIRVHVWLPSEMHPTQENTHDHNWWFHSKTMFGKLPYELLFQTDDKQDELAYSHIYEKNSAGNGQTKGSTAYTARPTGTVFLRVFETGTHQAGSRYNLHELVKHRILPPHEDTATFVMTGPRIRKTCGLYSKEPLRVTKDVKPMKIDRSTLHNLLDTLLQKLNGGNV